MKRPSPKMVELLKAYASENPETSRKAFQMLAKAIETPIKEGVLEGDNLSDIFEATEFTPGQAIEYPLDIVQKSSTKDHVAYVMPNHGYVPQRHVEGDYVTVPTYSVASSIDSHLKYLRDARWDVVSRMLEVLEYSVRRKLNDDGWHTILGAVVDRNINVFDADAPQGFFSKRLISLLKTSMKRNGGGNATSDKLSACTDVWLSPESLEDIRSWTIAEVDDVTRREIFTAGDDILPRLFNVNLHEMFELGENQPYQTYFKSNLGASLQANDIELVVALDLKNRDSFVLPIREQFTIWDDSAALFREGRFGWFVRGEIGFSALFNGRCLSGSL